MENFEARAFLENLAELDATSRLYTCPLTGFHILRAMQLEHQTGPRSV